MCFFVVVASRWRLPRCGIPTLVEFDSPRITYWDNDFVGLFVVAIGERIFD